MINFFKIISRVKKITGFLTEKQLSFALGLSPPDFSKRKKKGSGSLLVIITEWGIVQKVNLNWLITGKGSPYIIGENGNLDVDPEVNELLNMTKAVIKSDTGYARSLNANIRSFYDAVKTHEKIQDLEQRMKEMEKSRDGNQNGKRCVDSAAPKIDADAAIIKKSTG